MPTPTDPIGPPDATRGAGGDRTFGSDDLPSSLGEFPKVPGYDVLGELGLGGMGAVYRARDVRLRRDLALKVLLPRHLSNPELRRRFVEEAQICGQLQHPGVVPVHEVGTLPDG